MKIPIPRFSILGLAVLLFFWFTQSQAQEGSVPQPPGDVDFSGRLGAAAIPSGGKSLGRANWMATHVIVGGIIAGVNAVQPFPIMVYPHKYEDYALEAILSKGLLNKGDKVLLTSKGRIFGDDENLLISELGDDYLIFEYYEGGILRSLKLSIDMIDTLLSYDLATVKRPDVVAAGQSLHNVGTKRLSITEVAVFEIEIKDGAESARLFYQLQNPFYLVYWKKLLPADGVMHKEWSILEQTVMVVDRVANAGGYKYNVIKPDDSGHRKELEGYFLKSNSEGSQVEFYSHGDLTFPHRLPRL